MRDPDLHLRAEQCFVGCPWGALLAHIRGNRKARGAVYPCVSHSCKYGLPAE